MKRPLCTLGPVLLLLALPAGCGSEEAPYTPPSSDVEHCQENLRAIYAGLLAYKEKNGASPAEGGAHLFTELITSGLWENTPENASRLTCPGPGAVRPPGAPGTWFATASAIDGGSTAYAGRDLARFPLPSFPMGGTEILIACDNATGMNHAGVVNALFADGSIKIFRLETERERGTLGADVDVLAVGPGSPVADLAKLSAD